MTPIAVPSRPSRRDFSRTLRAARLLLVLLLVVFAAAVLAPIAGSDAVWLYGDRLLTAAGAAGLVALYPAVSLLTVRRREVRR